MQGGIENNVNRWRRQVDLEPLDKTKILNNAFEQSNSIGEYTIHEIVNLDKPDVAFLCMILTLDNSTVFIKLKTRLSEINKFRKSFLKFCSSFRYASN